DDEVGAAELRVVEFGAVVDGEQQGPLALAVGGAHRRAGGMDRQQGHQVGQFGVPAAGLGEQAGQSAGRVGGQVQQFGRGGQLLLAEAAVVGGGDQVGFGHLGAEVLPLDGGCQQDVDEVDEADRHGGAQ